MKTVFTKVSIRDNLRYFEENNSNIHGTSLNFRITTYLTVFNNGLQWITPYSSNS